MKRSLMALLAATIGFGAVACSDDDAEALSKAEYIEQADAICEATNAEMEPILDEFWTDTEGDDPSDQKSADAFYEEFAALIDELAPLMEDQIDDLSELPAPSEDSEELEALYTDVDSAVDEMQQIAEDAAAGDEATIARLDSGYDPLSEVNARAVEYGFAVCGVEE